MKYRLLFVLILAAYVSHAQSDVEISNALIDQPYAQCNAILAKMRIWFHYHHRETKTASGDDVKPKFYSIESNRDGLKVTKVWIIKYNKDKVIDEITINYRHDSKEQVQDEQFIAPVVLDYHIGLYSTDVVIRSKLRVLK